MENVSCYKVQGHLRELMRMQPVVPKGLSLMQLGALVSEISCWVLTLCI
jgi:hypothetical protein